MAFERLSGLLSRLYNNMHTLGAPDLETPATPEPQREKEGPPEASDYEKMIGDFSGHWNQSQGGLEDIMGKVSYHESKDKNVYQTGGGPGAGLFQYETGAGQGGMTARNRLSQWYSDKGMNTPDWLNQEGMEGQGFDASQLSEEQQKMLFMADKRYHPTASMSPEATENMGEWWAENHWAGGEKGSDVYNDRVSSFNRDSYGNQPVDDLFDNYNKVNDAFTTKS